MNDLKGLDTQELQELNGGSTRIYGSNGYSWRDKKGHWHYTVTQGIGSTVADTLSKGWVGALGGGWVSGGHK
ncbi:garvicin Q family class II bacteriocin [uncultured Secundilactobacillus sp.]|uniref:garvicin Q family class II bacteriocin n=1 Tax=uncultured Secundilactobacillus sp. TaxID=2813935 RepID=UPI00258455CC|nr:garvicin Q family class II bacteriocin [uncultured Secundilactobacillus sp.]